MPYIDGLPLATSILSTDVIAIDQGGTPGVPGTATTRQATIGQFTTGLAGVSSVNTRTGAVTLALSDIPGAAPLASPAFTGTPTAPTAAAGTNTTQLATTAFSASAIASANAGALFGLTLSNDAGTPNTILDISAGTCTNSTNTVTINLNAFTKSIAGNWVAGSGNNGMGVGLTATASTWYHVFAVIVSGVADVYFDTSVTAANKPASTTAFRRIGSFLLDGSVHIVPFMQTGDRFDLITPVTEVNTTPGVSTAHTLTLTSVPTGLPVIAILSGNVGDAVNLCLIYISSLAQADIAISTVGFTAVANPGTSGATALGSFSGFTVVTNSSAQIRWRVYATTTGALIITNGWIDTRGK